MEDVIAMARLVSKHKIVHVNLFGQPDNPNLKLKKLYNGILSGQIKDEESAIQLIYGTDKVRQTYKRLESRLRNRLKDALFLLNPRETSFTQMRMAKHYIAKETNLYNILVEWNEKATAFQIAKKTYKKAIKYEFTEYALLLARKLHAHYSFKSPNARYANHYQAETERLSSLLSVEIRAEQYYNQFSYMYVTRKSKLTIAEHTQIKEYVDELLEMLRSIDSYNFNYYAYNVITSYYVMINDYDATVKYCEEALSYFEQKPYSDNLAKWSLRNSLILGAIGSRNYTLAEECTVENFKVLTRGTYNWYMQCNFQVILLAAQQKYQELYTLLLDVNSTKRYKDFILQHEYWNVIEAYVHFLIRMGKIDPTLDTSGKKLRSFRMTRFVNDVPKFSKAKRGVNISILIIQFLFLLMDRKYSKLIDRLDAIKQYSYRYLKNDETYRSNLFIKMLLKVADADFHPIATKRYTKDYATKMYASNPSANFQSTEIEVIPYEKLWELVMELLERNKNK